MLTGQIISQEIEDGLIKIQYDVFEDESYLLSSEHALNTIEYGLQEDVDSYLSEYLQRLEAELI